MALKAQVIDTSVTPNAVVLVDVPSVAVSIISGGALVPQAAAVIVPVQGVVNPGGTGDGGVANFYLTDDGTDSGTDLFSSIIGIPVPSCGTASSLSIFGTIRSVIGVHRYEVKFVDEDASSAPDDTPVQLLVIGIPA